MSGGRVALALQPSRYWMCEEAGVLVSNEAAPSPPRRYDKGERRWKHVGKGSKPEFQESYQGARHVVGKCPPTITDAEKHRLLNMAIPLPNADRDLPLPKKVYAVHEGAVYEAQTSDCGRTYHGYPFKGKLSGALLGALRTMAENENCLSCFERWVKLHIERHGR